jgi:hypothetical protein
MPNNTSKELKIVKPHQITIYQDSTKYYLDKLSFSDFNQRAGFDADLTFTISLVDSARVKEVLYEKGESFKPQPDSEFLARRVLADATVREFIDKLTDYTTTGANDANKRNALINMFENKDKKIIEVSNLANEKVIKRTSTEYCSKLKQADIAILKLSEPEFKNNLQEVSYKFEQTFNVGQGRYCDITIKTVTLKLNAEGKYVVSYIAAEQAQRCKKE